MKKAVIFSGGDTVCAKTVKEYACPCDYIICCDSGSLIAKNAGITPNLVMGDFDSSDYDTFSDDVKKLKYPCEKDYTDTYLALNYLMENDYKDITVIGGLGGRLDHELANISLIYEAVKKDCRLQIVSDTNYITSVTKGNAFTAQKERLKNCYVSVLPLGSGTKSLTIKGFKYNIQNYNLCAFDTLCVSNELKDESGSISVNDGCAFVVVSLKN